MVSADCAQRPGIYEVWALKNVRPVTELILKTNFLVWLKHKLKTSNLATAWLCTSADGTSVAPIS
jgi:hypothetical protein